MKLRRSLREH